MGIHHVTAIAGDPARNLEFYTGALGLRLVKLTVNYDDPSTYHFYFGDERGRPGSILTFFPWPDGRPGRQGTGQVGAVSFAIPPASLGFWLERLLTRGIRYQGPTRRFGEPVLAFADPDSLHAATIWEDGDSGTAELLMTHLAFQPTGEEGTVLRLESAAEGVGTVVDLRRAPGFWRGAGGVGTVHHVAFRAGDDAEQVERRGALGAAGYRLTPVIDRTYFHSVYFREPGGVLFEIATDSPGFTVDEGPAELGTGLRLPPRFEPMRDRIASSLPPLTLPHQLQRTGADPWP